MQRVILKLFNAPSDREPPPRIQQIARRFNTRFTSLNPDPSDEALGAYFFADLPGDQSSSPFLEDLLQCEDVDGAYTKPEGEPPQNHM